MDHQPLDAAQEHRDQIEGDAASYLGEREDKERERERGGKGQRSRISIFNCIPTLYMYMYGALSCFHSTRVSITQHAHAQKIKQSVLWFVVHAEIISSHQQLSLCQIVRLTNFRLGT